MQSSEISELAKALVGAQADFPTIKKTKKATIQTKNGGSYSYDYADLGDIREAVVPTLTQYGLVITQAPSVYGDSPALTTTLFHTSGQWIESEMLLHIEKTDAQGQGSAITYARRYALSAILGIVTESDDDGGAATHGRREPSPVRDAGEYQDNQRIQTGGSNQSSQNFTTGNGYEHGSGNTDFDKILQAATISDNEFINDIAHKIETKGSLTDPQLESGLRAAKKILGYA
jgi:hypothetical protein